MFENAKLKQYQFSIVRSFAKTNGKDLNVFGQNVYILEYKATVDVIASVTGLTPGFQERCADELAKKLDLMICAKRIPDVLQGNRQTLSLIGEVRFEQTERGWKGEDGQLY